VNTSLLAFVINFREAC